MTQEMELGRKMKVLVVDDDEIAVKLYVNLLDNMGHRPVVAQTGKAAIEKALQIHFDLVILDLVLPDIHGIDVLKEIREYLRGAPVVIVTANPSLESSIDAIRAGGVYDYITKPFGQQDLKMVVARAIEKAALMTENKRLLKRLDATNQALTERVDQLEKFAHTAVGYVDKITELKNKIKDLEGKIKTKAK